MTICAGEVLGEGGVLGIPEHGPDRERAGHAHEDGYGSDQPEWDVDPAPDSHDPEEGGVQHREYDTDEVRDGAYRAQAVQDEGDEEVCDGESEGEVYEAEASDRLAPGGRPGLPGALPAGYQEPAGEAEDLSYELAHYTFKFTASCGCRLQRSPGARAMGLDTGLRRYDGMGSGARFNGGG